MGLIEETELFDEVRALAARIFVSDAELPNQVFRDHIREFVFVDVDDLFTEEFYAALTRFVISTSVRSWFFLMMYPDPKEFFKPVVKYPAFEVPTDTDYQRYWENVSKRHSSEIYHTIYDEGTSRNLLFTSSAEWGILMDRNFELGVAGFGKPEIAANFREAFGNENIFTVEEAIDTFLVPAYGSVNSVPRPIRNELVEHYGR